MNEYYKIEEICKVKGGKRIPQGCTLQDAPNEHPYIRILDMYQGRILNISDEMQYAKEEYWSIIKNYIVKKGDVILAIVGNTLGMVSIIGNTLDKANLTENCCKFDDLDTDKVRKLFLYYSLIAPLNQKNIEKFKVGSSQPKLPIYNINQLLIPKWSVEVQDKIVGVLSAIDLKIENNNKVLQNLEAMSKIIYDYWFLQFEFPNEDGKPYKSSGGKMVWNEELKREIPEGWRKASFSDMMEIGNGKDHTELNDGNIPVYGSGGVMRKVDASIYDGESVLIPRKGTLNNIIYVNGAFWTVDTMFYTKMKKAHSAIFVYYSAKLYDFEKLNTGTGVPSMTSTIIYNLKVVMPPEEILERFDNYVQAFYLQIQKNKIENEELSSLRNFLLPLLMNGQVGFKD